MSGCAGCAVANSGTESSRLAEVHYVGLFWQVRDNQIINHSLCCIQLVIFFCVVTLNS